MGACSEADAVVSGLLVGWSAVGLFRGDGAQVHRARIVGRGLCPQAGPTYALAYWSLLDQYTDETYAANHKTPSP